MRLPADATLLVVGAAGPAGDASAAGKVAALLAAWRREALPAFDLRGRKAAAFGDGGLEARLEDLGATTLVLCGEEGEAARAARDASALGFRAFVVRDACWRTGPESAAPSLDEAGLVVDAAMALAAASVAKARQRRNERRDE